MTCNKAQKEELLLVKTNCSVSSTDFCPFSCWRRGIFVMRSPRHRFFRRKSPWWEPWRTAFRGLIPHFNKPVKRMFPLLATWKISCVVRTYVIFTRARGARATSCRHQQHIAEAPLEGGRLTAKADFEASWRKMAARRAERKRPRGGASGDEFARLGRAANPLHRAGVDAELRGDLAHAEPSGNRQSVPNALF
jgi:hypothetical protein